LITQTRQMSPQSLWIGAAPLLLASKSAGRRALLAASGLPFDSMPAEIDERALEETLLRRGDGAAGLAAALARAKALEVSARRPDALTLGADQTLLLDGRLLHKSATLAEAAAALGAMSGRTHRLTSAFTLARAGRVVAEDSDFADLTMRSLDAEQIARYLTAAGTGVLASVGAYQLEGLGAHLFDKIAGEHSTIVGLPMLKLLATLRGLGALAI
jgi:septum formation protein